jgi:inositol transport system ATP-binding protein
MNNSEHALRMEHITIEFPGVKALNDVSVSFRKGRVTALMGENGAGKSTLMKILIGLNTKYTGEIYIDGQKVQLNSLQDSRENGISMIHQELNPVPLMTVAENIFMGREISGKLKCFVNFKEQNKKAKALLDSMNISIDPGTRMKDLSVAEMQMIEIIKAVSFDASIIIMDEPTSAITDTEVEELFRIIAKLKEQGKTIIYISHKMDEIFRIADDIIVLRDGHFICQEKAEDLTEDQLIAAMVGRTVEDIYPKLECRPGGVYLEVKNATVRNKFENVSFQVRRGEILGIAGLMGAGRTELAEAIFGMVPLDGGEILIEGKKVHIRSEGDAIRRGIALVSEDRKALGLNLNASVKENISIVHLNDYCAGNIFLRLQKERKAAEKIAGEFQVKCPSLDVKVETLSGGNQQKVVLAKWMLGDPELVIFDEPTRGIDVAAKAEIHKMMSEFAAKNKAVIMISSEMPEIIGMSDRAIVLHDGKLTGELKRDEFSQERIMNLAIGRKVEDTK